MKVGVAGYGIHILQTSQRKPIERNRRVWSSDELAITWRFMLNGSCFMFAFHVGRRAF
jgi:hypothetical protein